MTAVFSLFLAAENTEKKRSSLRNDISERSATKLVAPRLHAQKGNLRRLPQAALGAAAWPSLLPNVLLRLLVELHLTALGAEVNRLPFVFAGGGGLFGINRHFAYRVNNLHDFTSSSGTSDGRRRLAEFQVDLADPALDLHSYRDR